MTRMTGTWERSTVAGESVAAFVPHPLPPAEPPLNLDGELSPLLGRAGESLRLFELAGDLVPSVEWFVYAFVRKEAVLSAQIEGTQATLMDLLELEASGEAPVDAHLEEVCGYTVTRGCQDGARRALTVNPAGGPPAVVGSTLSNSMEESLFERGVMRFDAQLGPGK